MRVARRGGGEAVAAAVEAAGASNVPETDADVLLDVGDGALVSVADDPPPAPVLPVATGEAHHAVARSRLAEALAAVDAGDHRLVEHALLDVSLAGSPVGRAVADATLMTSAPARISEYAVHGERERVEQIRADGVVAATPLGSDGYARSAGGPILGPGAGLSVVPVAPFSTLADAWVLTPPLTLTVERDEGDVSLFLDDERAAAVTTETPVRLARGETLSFVRAPGMGGHRIRQGP